MSFRSFSDQQDVFNSAWDDPKFQYWVPPTGLGGQEPATPVVPTPALSGETIQAEAAQAGTTSIDVITAGGITFDLIFDAAATSAPASFRAGIEQAAALLAATISNKITVNIQIDYSGTGGGAAAGPDNGQYVNYSTVRADLIANAASGDPSFNALPAGTTIQGQSQVAVWNAQLKLWGLLPANSTTTDDGSATFATDINSNMLVGVALHELTHALGRVPYGPPDGPQPDIFDFYRFTSVGARLIADNIPASAAYFSLNGGSTKLADYGLNSDPSDFLNSGVQGSNDPFDEYYSNGTVQHLTAVDLKQLDALGFNVSPPDTQPPTLVHDNVLSILAGLTGTITSGLLSASDNASSAAQLHFTVVTAPTDGSLWLNGLATTSFTQADINNGLVSYHETASSVTTDNFVFTVTDAAGNVTGTDTFQIGIEPVFSGDRSSYQTTYNSATQVLDITDERPGSPDGTHSLNQVQKFQFADGTSTYNFNTAGAIVSETFNNVNGSHLVNTFDTDGNQAWAWEISTFDPNGNLTSQSGLHHDGSHFLTLYDVSHQYIWTTAAIEFDANWNETSITGTDASGLHSLTSQDIAAAYDTAQWYATPFDTIVNQAAVGTVVASSTNKSAVGHSGSDPSASAQDSFIFNFSSTNSNVAGSQISPSEFGESHAVTFAPLSTNTQQSTGMHSGHEFTSEDTYATSLDSDIISKLPGFDIHHTSGFPLV